MTTTLIFAIVVGIAIFVIGMIYCMRLLLLMYKEELSYNKAKTITIHKHYSIHGTAIYKTKKVIPSTSNKTINHEVQIRDIFSKGRTYEACP